MTSRDEAVMDRNMAIEAVRVTEAAAIAAERWVGRGDEREADAAAVDAMRTALNKLNIDGTVVIGEGERDEAPMLYIGEKVGAGGPKIDIALDPLEGTTITAKANQNAMAVLALAPDGDFLNAPDVYMEKIAIGGGYPDGIIDIDAPPAENLKRLAEESGRDIGDLTVCILDRPRHEELIANVRDAGARIFLISDGDIFGVMAAAARPRAFWRRRRFRASAGRSRGSSCSATTTRSAAPASSASRISTGFTAATISPPVT
jgi:fructose-1,6-bisphosphatase II / sedoheptulose-1,7-bisphosphatase